MGVLLCFFLDNEDNHSQLLSIRIIRYGFVFLLGDNSLFTSRFVHSHWKPKHPSDPWTRRARTRRTYSESSGQATTHTMPCPMDQANQFPSGEKSTLHVSQPARPSRDGGRRVFSSRIRDGSAAGGTDAAWTQQLTGRVVFPTSRHGEPREFKSYVFAGARRGFPWSTWRFPCSLRRFRPEGVSPRLTCPEPPLD